MPYPFDPSEDFAVVDGHETISLHRRAGGEPEMISQALRRAAKVRDPAGTGGNYTRADAVWHIPSAALDEPPEVGDRIEDAVGEFWAIVDVEEAALASRWRCAARRRK